MLDLGTGRTRSLSVDDLNGGAITLVIGTGTNEVGTVASSTSFSICLCREIDVRNRFGWDVGNLVKKVGLQEFECASAHIVFLLFSNGNSRKELCERSQGGFQVPKLCEKRDHMFLMSELLKVLGHDTKVLAKIIKMDHGGLTRFFDRVNFLHGNNRIVLMYWARSMQEYRGEWCC